MYWGRGMWLSTKSEVCGYIASHVPFYVCVCVCVCVYRVLHVLCACVNYREYENNHNHVYSWEAHSVNSCTSLLCFHWIFLHTVGIQVKYYRNFFTILKCFSSLRQLGFCHCWRSDLYLQNCCLVAELCPTLAMPWTAACQATGALNHLSSYL